MNFLKNILLLCLLGLADSCIPTFNPDFDEELLTTTQKACPTGWSLFMDSCYIAVRKYTSYQAAEDNCVSLGGHLVSIHSQAEEDFVSALNEDYVWIGLSAMQNTYGIWTDGTPVDYTFFGTGAPDARPDAAAYLDSTRSLVADPTLTARMWYSSTPTYPTASICEKPL